MLSISTWCLMYLFIYELFENGPVIRVPQQNLI